MQEEHIDEKPELRGESEGKEQDQAEINLAQMLMNQRQTEYNKERDDKEEKFHQKFKDKLKSEQMFIYFCAICGKKAIVANIGLDTLPNRRSDRSIAIHMKQVFLQHYLQPDTIKYIKRPDYIEKQYRLKCEECGVFIAYHCIPYEQAQDIHKIPDNQLKNRPYLYVLDDALVINQQFSKLYSEVARLKDQLVT